MQPRLPDVRIVNGFFDSYRNICKIEATSSEEGEKIVALRRSMEVVDNNNKWDKTTKLYGTLSTWLDTLHSLHTEIMTELRILSGEGQKPPARLLGSLWETAKNVVYSENVRDRLLKSLMAARANISKVIFSQVSDELKEVETQALAVADEEKLKEPSPFLPHIQSFIKFQKQRIADYAQIEKLEKEIRGLQTEIIKQTGKQDLEEIELIEQTIQKKQKERRLLIEKYFILLDPKAVQLAVESGMIIYHYRDLKGFSSKYAPSYVLLQADEYFFNQIIKSDDKRSLGERSLKQFESNCLTDHRKYIIPYPGSTSSSDHKENNNTTTDPTPASEPRLTAGSTTNLARAGLMSPSDTKNSGSRSPVDNAKQQLADLHQTGLLTKQTNNESAFTTEDDDLEITLRNSFSG